MNIWNEAIWKEINDEVRQVAATIRVAQKVFPTVVLDNPSNIPDDRVVPTTFTIEEGLTKALAEISAEFTLTPNQVVYEGSLHAGLKLAKLRASDLARNEDLIFFRGRDAFPPPPPAPPNFPPGIRVRNLDSAGKGLLGVATTAIPVPVLVPPQPGVLYGQNTFAAVVRGIGVLNGKSQPGPFALIVDFRIFADAYSLLGQSLTTAADLITPLVTGGFFGTAALPPCTGLLVSLGGEPTTLYVGVDATTALIGKEQEENHVFRVFERVQFDAKDPRAFVRLNFAPVILKLDPDNGPINGGTPVTIEGIGFDRSKSVKFDQTVIQPGAGADQFQIADDAHIKLNSPRRANAGGVDVTVTSQDDVTSNAVKFTYNP